MIWRDILEINLGYIIEMILLISLIILFISLIACHVYKKMNEKYNSDIDEGFESAPLESAKELESGANTSPGDQSIQGARAGQIGQADSSQKAKDAEAQTMHNMQGKLNELINLSNQAKEITENFTNKF